jgi:hypothetical protein
MTHADLKNPSDLDDFPQLQGKWVYTWPFGTHASVECWYRNTHPKVFDSSEHALAAKGVASLDVCQVRADWPKVAVN